MGVQLYIDILSQPCRALVIFIKLNKLDVEIKEVSLFKGEHKSEWYKKINPMSTVPLLADGDFYLTESAAMLRYLKSKFKIADSWYPQDAQQAARLTEYVVWQFCPGGLRTNGVNFFVASVILPMRTGQPCDKDALVQKVEGLQAALSKMETYFLSHGDFLAGTSDVTVADLLAICEIMQPLSVQFDVFGGRPKLEKWFNRTKAKLQPYFDETHQTILDFGAKHK